MLLSVLERLTLLSILPEKGNLTTIQIVARLRENLSFTEKEHKVLQFREEGEGDKKQLRWTPIPDAEVEVGLKAVSIVHDVLKALDDAESLTPQHISLCEKFDYPGK